VPVKKILAEVYHRRVPNGKRNQGFFHNYLLVGVEIYSTNRGGGVVLAGG
jgi:hypothetical protein